MRGLLARALIYLYAQTFNATGYGRAAEGAVSPPKTPSPRRGHGGTMPTEHLAKLLNDFQGAYGRLCLLTCQALSAGEDRTKVHAAFNGSVTSPFTKIVAAYALSDLTLKAAQPCGETAVVEAAYKSRKAIEGEWMVEIDPRVIA